MMKKKGFTIVELLMVIAILAVLMGIITTAASESAKSGRRSRADALCAAVQSGLATYYAQKGQWPGALGSKIDSGSIRANSNNEGVDEQTDEELYVLSGSEVREMVKALVDEAKQGNPMMDISALFVSRGSGEKTGGGNWPGMDFMAAVRGTRQSKKKMKTAEMYYGYPDPETGTFRRFKMVYSIPADQVTVSRQ